MKSLSKVVLAMSLFVGGVAGADRIGPSAGYAPMRVEMPPPTVQAPSRALVREKLSERRAVMIQRFIAYRNARVYPVNTDPGMQHVWRDANGHLCAAATMISADWGVDGTVRAAGGDNHIALATVKTGAVADWMLTSGLTHHEIVAIQAPGFQMPRPDIDPGDPVREAEVQRLFDLYIDVERQLGQLGDESLDEATDALMAHPELARKFVVDVLPSAPPPLRKAVAATPPGVHFAQPPPG